MKYRKKPQEVDAVQYTGQKLDYLEYNWDGNPITTDKVTIMTAAGRVQVKLNDFIITYHDGTRSVSPPDQFKRFYEKVKKNPEEINQEETTND